MGDKSAAMIRAEMEQTRAAMEATLEELQSRLTPLHLAQDVLGAVGDATAEKVKEMTSDVKQNARSLGRKVAALYDANPLAFGLSVLAAGALIGLAIPLSKRENELLAPHREKLIDHAKDAVSQLGAVAKELVEQTG